MQQTNYSSSWRQASCLVSDPDYQVVGAAGYEA